MKKTRLFVIAVLVIQFSRAQSSLDSLRMVLPIGHTDVVTSAVFSPDGKYALTASGDNTARIYEVSSGKDVLVLSGHTRFVNSAVFSPDWKYVLTASNDETSRICDVASGKELHVLSGHTEAIESAVFSVDGNCALMASDDNTANIVKLVYNTSGDKVQCRILIFKNKVKIKELNITTTSSKSAEDVVKAVEGAIK